MRAQAGALCRLNSPITSQLLTLSAHPGGFSSLFRGTALRHDSAASNPLYASDGKGVSLGSDEGAAHLVRCGNSSAWT